MSTTDRSKRKARDLAHELRIEPLARLGYAAKGIVFIIIGALVIRAALGIGSANVNQQTVFQTIISQPFGKFLLGVVAVGLLGYALWRLVQAIVNPENEGTLTRVGHVISALVYGLLAYTAYGLIVGTGGGATKPSDWTAKVMSLPFGLILIGLAGIIIIGVAIYTLYQAYKIKFERQFMWNKMNATERRTAITLGRIGYAAQAIVFAVVGIFLVQSASNSDPNRAGGLGDAIVALSRQPYGLLMLWIVGIGMIAYGIYALFMARYRRIYV